ncbi:MAG: NADH:ubiquinone oxidoreductase [Spirochaetes bacterium]|nr:MAG: NADH:ubiquinone oxidoreductase [Spirochaetota bacterium]
MKKEMESTVKNICRDSGNDKIHLLDILRRVQNQFGCVSDEAIDLIAKSLNIPRVDVESTVTFYSFLSKEPKGQIVIRLCNDIIDRMNGYDKVAKAFREELGIDFGETTKDGKISLENTPCIGMCDQAPAALVNGEVVTYLSTDRAREIVKILRLTGNPKKLVQRLGDGNNAHELVKSMVQNNIRRAGEVVFSLAESQPNIALEKALAMSPVEVINEVKTARLRGRGGAGFPTGMKWEFTRAANGDKKYIICNADEGEPGTFKDRVLLTELPDRIFEGMTIAGYAIGAEEGIMYLRGEYEYLYNFLEATLEKRRKDGLLGKNVMGKKEFNFDIRIQLGAGAYICGEETALISSCEGFRGDPKNRPPFPAQRGFLGYPSCINNVETFCAVLSILDKGAGWFAELGSRGSAGTKVLSVSGDCQSPGIYEYPFGITIKKLLKDVGAEDAMAVQVGGASGQMIGEKDYDRIICFDDLATGGSIMIFGPQRNILEVVDYFMEFFIEESCGYCTPCRVGNVVLRNYLQKIISGKGEPSDLDFLQKLGENIKAASRCGLGQTSPNPILSTLKNFHPVYAAMVREETEGLQPTFDIQAALRDSEAITGRKSVLFIH